MKGLVIFVLLQALRHVTAEIKDSALLNKLSNIKPVGNILASRFMPLTEIPPPRRVHYHSGRRHLEPDCTGSPVQKLAYEGPNAEIFGEYYDDKVAKAVATVIIPDHIDRKHFEITTQVPYLTVGTIEAIGYHPSTIKSDHPSECEKIYQDHMDDQYSEDEGNFSEESMEVARVALLPEDQTPPSNENFYSDM